MVPPISAFSGFSVDDTDAAARFYGETLGLDVELGGQGILDIVLPGGGHVIAYPKGEHHEPATFTILNLVVPDIEAAVDDLRAQGVSTKIYSDDEFPTDSRGIMREMGPTICWFRDPAGNTLALIEEDAPSTP